MKKVIAMVLALVMVLAIGVVAFAAPAREVIEVLPLDPNSDEYNNNIQIPRFGRYYYGFGFLDDDDPVEFYISAENPDTGAPVMIGSYVAGAVVLVVAAAYVAKHNK